MYAQVVFGLPLENAFDYFIPPKLERELKKGSRVIVSFGRHNLIGFVVGKSRKTTIKKTKPILELIDKIPIFDKSMLRLSKGLSSYYACSLGQAIEATLPQTIRQGQSLVIEPPVLQLNQPADKKSEIILLHDVNGKKRWQVYFKETKKTLEEQGQVIVLFSDFRSALSAQKRFAEFLGIEVGLWHSRQRAKEELEQWRKIKEGKINVVVGIRQAVFSPFINLGLIIIDEEEDEVYKQEQVPYYHASHIAQMRAADLGARLILASTLPRLESWHSAKKRKFIYLPVEINVSKEGFKIIDLHEATFLKGKKRLMLPVSLEDAINQILKEKGRILLFVSRRGFARFCVCQSCGWVLKCPRCNINLIYYYKKKELVCHYCNYRRKLPLICPECESGYIRCRGLGTEKLESELYRLYPGVKIACVDRENQILPEDAQIIISTQYILKLIPGNLDLVAVISEDVTLNRPDFRAAEKSLYLLLRLAGLGRKRMLIQTNLAGHYIFQALIKNDLGLFYNQELVFRKQSGLPPFSHMIKIKVRSRKQPRAEKAAYELFEILNKGDINVVSVSPDFPAKIRDKFYMQILIKTKGVRKTVRLIKRALHNFQPGGIIITIDVDPI